MMKTMILVCAFLAVAVEITEGLSCYCQGVECQAPRGCTAGYTMDVCGCCTVCAKDVGQRCGGLWGLDGACGEEMKCVKPRKREQRYFSVGVCQWKESSNHVEVYPKPRSIYTP